VTLTAARSELPAALAELATVFAYRPYRPGMPACPHCVSDEDLRGLGRPVDEIPLPLLARYARKALTTWGEVPDLQRLLPRLLALVAEGAPPIDAAVVAAKLARGGWTHWPVHEREAVSAFFGAWWDDGLRSPPGAVAPPVPVRLDAAAATADLASILERWHLHLDDGEPDVRLTAALHLAELVNRPAFDPLDRLAAGRLLSVPADGAVEQLSSWLAGSTTAIQLARAVYDFVQHPEVSRLATADVRLARFRVTRS